jgi:hypothetical protein
MNKQNVGRNILSNNTNNDEIINLYANFRIGEKLPRDAQKSQRNVFTRCPNGCKVTLINSKISFE